MVRKRKLHSTTEFNEQLRNQLSVKGKIVAATDFDLVIYTPKGSAFVIEQKSKKAYLYKRKYITLSKLQLDHYVRTAKLQKQNANSLLVVYNNDEIEDYGRDAKILVCNMAKCKKTELGRFIKYYKISIDEFRKMSVKDFIRMVTSTIAKEWLIK